MRHTHFILACTALLFGLSGCGGGGDGGSPAPPVTDGGLNDPTVYSSAEGAALSGAQEAAATTKHNLTLAGQTLAYTATAGHLIARHVTTQAAQASMFYVAYTLDGAPGASRPVTFFYNGGPGSASVWLQLGSFGPKRLVTGVPAMTATRPFPLVDNADSLLDTSDLVFVNAVGSGRSQAIAPFTNGSFWGVDSDAELFRDFILRWLEVHGRASSPKFLYGESYGGPRSAILARRLQEVGVMLDGLVLQSPAMDYNSNCGVNGIPNNSCAGYLPSLAAVGAWHRRTTPVPTDIEVWLAGAEDLTTTRYAPALDAWLGSSTQAPALWLALADLTGWPQASWQLQLNLAPTPYRQFLLPGQLLGRFDGRMFAPNGSALASEGDPSSSWIVSSFAAAVDTHLAALGYRNASTYVLLSGAINRWDFSHAGRPLPDTVPDLAAALAQNPNLRVLAVSGMHDLATPYFITETDLLRLSSGRVATRRYPGGHMSFLDDATRPLQKADLVAFYAGALAARTVRAAPQAKALAAAGRRGPAPDRTGTPQQPGDVPLVIEPAMQSALRGPWVPGVSPP